MYVYYYCRHTSGWVAREGGGEGREGGREGGDQLQAPSAGFDRLLPLHSNMESRPGLQPREVSPQLRVVLQQSASLYHTSPPHVEPHHTVCRSELVSTHKQLPAEVTGENVGTDVELPAHGVHQRCVAPVLGRVGELHVQRFNDGVKCGRRVGNETISVCVCVCVYVWVCAGGGGVGGWRGEGFRGERNGGWGGGKEEDGEEGRRGDKWTEM